MERIFLYMLAIADILVGFAILHRSSDRFGFDTYRSFLDRQERQRRTGSHGYFESFFQKTHISL